jgi:CheY-specific phosphatase CheX
LLTAYPEYTVNLATRYGKEINPFEIVGGEVLVDHEQYWEFTRSLTHVFRNTVAHGIETAEDRIDTGKEMVGNVLCNVEQFGNYLILRITDDGKGIDPAVIRQAASDKGICSQERMESLSEDEILQLIFADGFSSSCEVNELAGRGVGLSAVKVELEKLGGSLQVVSMIGQGTEFRFILPLHSLGEMEPLIPLQFSEAILQNTTQYLQEVLQVPKVDYVYDGVADGLLPLRSVSTFIELSGYMQGKVVLSADSAIAREIAATTFGSLDEIEIDTAWFESAFGENFNVAVGNALQTLPETKNIEINVPLTIQAKGACAKFLNAQVHRWTVQTDKGYLTLSLIVKERDDDDGKYIDC